MITINYRAVDGARDRRTFKTLTGAQKFAHKLVGAHPEIGSWYAVAGDGVGRVTCTGCTIAELFPLPVDHAFAVFSDPALDRHGQERLAWYAQRDDGAAFGPFESQAEADEAVRREREGY